MFFRSLRVRLPLLMTALVAAVLAVFLWAAKREVERTVLSAGGERALVAATQLSNVLAQSSARGLADIQRLAADEQIGRFLLTRAGDLTAAVEQRLRPLAVAGQPPVALLNEAGERILEVKSPSALTDLAASVRVPSGVPGQTGIAPFKKSQNVVFSDVVVEVWDPPAHSGDDAAPEGKRAGFLVIRRMLLSGPNADVIGRLVGTGASIAIGNRAGDLWTDFSGHNTRLSVDASRPGISSRQGDDGGTWLGGLSVIDGTPWAVWVEFPSSLILLPAHAFIVRLGLVAIGFVLVAAALVTVVSARITKPLVDLTQASEAIAAGEYSTHVRTDRRDEIGRLGVAFTTMTEQVAKAQRTLEERVSRRTATLDHFFALSPDMLCIADMNGRFIRVNAAWQDVLGWSADELTSRPYVEFIHPDDQQATSSESGHLADGQATQRFENRYRCKDGSYRWLSWKATPIVERGVIYAAARDVTERRRLTRELEDRASELAILNQELEAFSYSVSHDLRAPLRHVTGFVALLERSAAAKLDAEELRRLQTISEAATRMGRLIDDLLAFSRMSRTAFVKRRISLDEISHDARRELSADPASEQATWVVHPLPEIDGDPAMLRLVFVNLIGNALKYSRQRAEPRIEIGTQGDSDGQTVIFVRDNGVGFDMQYADKLFGVFQRLHRSEEFEGTGIGLANVRRIVHRHGGRVWAEGTIDGGATFYFSLPRA